MVHHIESEIGPLGNPQRESGIPLGGIRPEIGVGLGVVDIKRTEIESADQIARAIERADRAIGVGRVRYIHPDCGFWMLKRPIADAKIRALAAGRDLYEGHDP